MNVQSATARLWLVHTMGRLIDKRGGHAAGYVAIRPGRVDYNRKEGAWSGASRAFVEGACGDLTVLHARFATCGKGGETEAHPFAPRRAGADGRERTALWGVHNGMIDNARESAKAHGRPYDVDSRELFELLADGNLDAIRALQGYGTLAWIERALRDRVRLVRMTESADLEIASTACGAVIYGSTREIVQAGAQASGLRLTQWYTPAVGKVTELHSDGRVTYSDHADVTLATRVSSWTWQDTWDPLEESAESVDEDDGAPCPSCDSIETWIGVVQGHCDACGTAWPLRDVYAEGAS